MKILAVLFKTTKKESNKSIADYQLESLIRTGREQFKALADKGLGIPVALL